MAKRPSWLNSIKPSDITPEEVYLSRRSLLKKAGFVGAAGLLAACMPPSAIPSPTEASLPADLPIHTGTPAATGTSSQPSTPQPSATAVPEILPTEDLGSALTPYDKITGYVNFYEFSTNKLAVAEAAKDFQLSPWEIEVGGLVQYPKKYSIDELLQRFPSEERIYRMRCVETWSMVIPWMGFPLGKLLEEVEPMGSARFVRFETRMDTETMPGLAADYFSWPYTEGLRLDEALHDLTILSSGLYGKDLLIQNGAPLRLVVPWKYGFKSTKSIVKIELVEEMPGTFWAGFAPREYGFYANVNPKKPHPRWSQEQELRIGETDRRPTLQFNGYAEEVASLYTGMYDQEEH